MTASNQHSDHLASLNEFRGFNPKYDAALDGLVEQLEAALARNATYGPTAEEALDAADKRHARLLEQYEVRTQNVLDCNERSRALAEKCVELEEQLEAAEEFKAAMVRANQRQVGVVNAAIAYCSNLNNRGEADTDDLEAAIAALYPASEPPWKYPGGTYANTEPHSRASSPASVPKERQ